jgi:serine/threonine protein phosphatase PrpC
MTARPTRCPLIGGELSADQAEQLSRPELSILVPVGADLCRVHWIARSAWEQWRPEVERRQRCTAAPLPPCRVVEESAGTWIAVPTTGRRAQPWTTAAASDFPAELRRLTDFVEPLARGLEQLHEHDLVWLTFDPLEIEEAAADQVRFTNLDLKVYPARECPEQLPVRPAFAAPEIWHFVARDIGPASDVYHLALFAYYWLAGLLPRGFNGGGLEAFGFAIPPLRVFAPGLPPGITGVVSRGLALDARRRFPRPLDFAAELNRAVERAEQRLKTSYPVQWEIGQHTRAGKAKTALGRENEDRTLVQVHNDPPRALVAVADGITMCDVGSGALASLMTCLVLENALDDQTRRETFVAQMPQLCRRSAETLLSWALEKGYRQQLQIGRDLMGTTLTAGWLEGNTLTLANLGDSRAYLVTDEYVEQLTVDGDLGSGLLASGVPPEEVRDLGGMAKALRDCIGGCVADAQGDPQILEDYCRPVMSTWTLQAGDVLVLCSDGLVEEGAFLDPDSVADIIRQNPQKPSQDVAEQLAQAADARQRLPSALEPEGFGDNITCIVIKIRGSQG